MRSKVLEAIGSAFLRVIKKETWCVNFAAVAARSGCLSRSGFRVWGLGFRD